MTRELYRPDFLLIIKQSDFVFAKDIFSLILSAWFKWSELLVRHTIGKVDRMSEICRPKMRLCTTPVRKTGKKAIKHPISNPQNTRKKPRKHPISNPQNKRKGPESVHYQTRKHKKTSFKKKFQQTCRNQKTLIPGLGTEPRPTKPWRHIPRHMTWHKNQSQPIRQKPTKKASKRTLQKSQQTHPKMVPTCLLFEDITRQRNSEFDTLHATDPAQKPLLQSSMMT